MGRTILFLVVLVVAAAAPYLIHHSSNLVSDTGDNGENADSPSLLTRLIGGNSGDAPTDDPLRDLQMQSFSGGQQEQLSPTGPTGLSIADLLRFDATKVWIQQNWKNVTSDLPAHPLHGYRVPVMTGTQPYDIAGSLTYYFNSHHRVERITLHGFTSDYTAVATLVQQRFGLTQYASVGPATFLAFYGNNPISFMRIQVGPAPSASQGSNSQGPITRFEIDLEINLPTEEAMLSADKLQELFDMQRADMI